MKAKKSQDLPSASWRFRKDSGIVQSESEGLRTRKAEGVKSQSEGRRSMSQPRENKFFFSPSFVIFRLNDTHTHKVGQSALLRISSGNTVTDMSEIMISQI